MAIFGTPGYNSLHCWPRQHAIAPGLYIRPIIDIYAKEGKHPGHRIWEIRDISYGRSVRKSNVALPWQPKSFIQYIPLCQGILMKPFNKNRSQF